MASTSANVNDYICNLCGVRCKNQGDLIDHNNLVHKRNEEGYKCNICDYRSLDRLILANHIRNMHSIETYNCIICGRTSFLNGDYIQHQDSVHRFRDKYKCWFCMQEFDCFSLLTFHYTEAHCGPIITRRTVYLRCYNCGHIDRPDKLHIHLLKMHSSDRYTCKICDIVLVSLHAYKEHQQYEHKYSDTPDIYVCNVCEQFCGGFSFLIEHYQSYHRFAARFVPWTCNVCLDVFDTRIELGEHMTVHSETHPFQCIHCEYRYCNRMTVEIHTQQQHKEQT